MRVQENIVRRGMLPLAEVMEALRAICAPGEAAGRSRAGARRIA